MIYGEKFIGLFTGMPGDMLAKTREGFYQMNNVLKKECEKVPLPDSILITNGKANHLL